MPWVQTYSFFYYVKAAYIPHIVRKKLPQPGDSLSDGQLGELKTDRSPSFSSVEPMYLLVKSTHSLGTRPLM